MGPFEDTVEKVRDTILQYAMTDPGDLVLVAVSGGPDSMCLLDVLNGLSDKLDIRLVVAHYNHGLRESEDENETRLVEKVAESMELPFVTEKAFLLENGSASLEERARDARYGFLEKMRAHYHARRIAVGHNLNDQAETVLMRLLRGSGPSGMAGIPPIRDNRIIRPLIEIKREEIMRYLAAHELPYAIDSSNSNPRHLRNRVRLELLPMMQDYQPRIIEHLGRLSIILRAEDAFLDKQAADWIDREAVQESAGPISVPVLPFKKLPVPLKNRVVRFLLKKIQKNLHRIDHDHIKMISGLAHNRNPQAMLDLPNGIIVRKEYDSLLFTRGAKNVPRDFCYTIKGPGTLDMEDIGVNLLIEEMDGGFIPDKGASRSTAYLDAEKLPYPLVLRNFRQGDRFIPLGMKGHKKVKNFFIDLKVPSGTRFVTPILTSRDRVVWICGYRIDDGFKVTPRTKKILKVTIL